MTQARNVYSIGLAASLTGRCIATLRRWDMEGVFLARKDRRGRRVYNGADLVELRELAATRKAGRKPKKPAGA